MPRTILQTLKTLNPDPVRPAKAHPDFNPNEHDITLDEIYLSALYPQSSLGMLARSSSR